MYKNVEREGEREGSRLLTRWLQDHGSLAVFQPTSILTQTCRPTFAVNAVDPPDTTPCSDRATSASHSLLHWFESVGSAAVKCPAGFIWVSMLVARHFKYIHFYFKAIYSLCQQPKWNNSNCQVFQNKNKARCEIFDFSTTGHGPKTQWSSSSHVATKICGINTRLKNHQNTLPS